MCTDGGRSLFFACITQALIWMVCGCGCQYGSLQICRLPNSFHWYIIVPGRQAPAITRTSASRHAGFPTAKFSAPEANCHLAAPRLGAFRLFSSPKYPAYYNLTLLFGPPFVVAPQACQVATSRIFHQLLLITSSVQTIEEWADSRVQTFPLQHLAGAVIGVDASYYLDLRLNKALKASAESRKASPESSKNIIAQDGVKKGREPLFNALGGIPCSLQEAIEKDVEILKKYDVSLTFVFNGLDYATKEPSGARSATNLRAHEEGWQAYKNDDEDATVKAFGKAGKMSGFYILPHPLTSQAFTVETLYRWFQRLLKTLGVQFLVAPYGAAAQVCLFVFMQVTCLTPHS
jgi:hypothetical protein